MAAVARRRTSRNGGQGDLQVGGEDGHGRSPKGLESLERRLEAGEDAVGGLDHSAFGKKGYNVVLFDPADAKLTCCFLFEAKSLKFGFEQSDNPYWVEKDGTTKTVCVADVRPIPPSEEAEP